MSDPITVSTATEGAPDTGAEVAELPLTETPHEPAADAPPEQPERQPEGPPEWFTRGRSYNERRSTGYNERQRQVREENRRLKALEERFTAGESRTQELLKTATDLLRARNGGAAEEIPDPTLDPQGFAKWLAGQNKTGLEEQLKPILEHVTAQRQMIEQLQQGRAEEAEQQRIVQQEIGSFRQAAAEYAKEEPELAAGAEDRFREAQAVLTECFEGEERPADIANFLLFKVAEFGRNMGYNEVAYLDNFASRLFYNVGRRLGIPIQPMGPAAATAAPGNGNGNGHQPAGRPVMTEAQRQEEVRRRTAAASSAAPRQPAAGLPAGRSKAQETYDQLLKLGQLDNGWGKIRAAALEDAGGNEKEAAMIMAGLRG